MWWKILNVSSLVLVSFTVFSPGVAASGLVLSVQPDSVCVEVSSELYLSFYLGEGTENIMGYHVVFSYDPEYLEVLEVEEGSLPPGSGDDTFFHCNSSLSDTTVEISGAVLGAEVQTPGTLFVVTFRALKAGRTYVEIQYSDLRDGSNDGIAHSTERGVVVITPEISVEKVSWGRIKSRYR